MLTGMVDLQGHAMWTERVGGSGLSGEENRFLSSAIRAHFLGQCGGREENTSACYKRESVPSSPFMRTEEVDTTMPDIVLASPCLVLITDDAGHWLLSGQWQSQLISTLLLMSTSELVTYITFRDSSRGSCAVAKHG